MPIRHNTIDTKPEDVPDLPSEKAQLDWVDKVILQSLIRDARLPRAELARRVGMSPPAVGERLRRLEETGVILGYHAQINPARLGFGLTIMIRAQPDTGQMADMIAAIEATPQIVRCERISDKNSLVAWAHVRSVAEMEQLTDRLMPHGKVDVSIVQSTPVEPRPLPLEKD
ncbi:Lrp/AsnC family transcriptional regulator [Chachezhania sediminis]|uniref:Lrp/AsnC family transcriptional regulator n=1 Tax=Chachezhania sediminis TaxID=2599291 RepID=UPI00131D3AE8|nr:Lrp/AsnC family transcriptional regulator [Chachezhania sediminis]